MKALMPLIALGLSVLSLCLSAHEDKLKNTTVTSGSASRPNILWLVVEDMSPILSMYGDFTANTPALNELAAQGVTYTNVYSPSGVCAPSRAAIAMGLYPTSFGANHMRTTSNTQETGLPKYEAVPPTNAKMLSQHLQELGYYTTNNLKTDYQFEAPRSAWHESGPFAHWQNRAPNQPFYAVVNFTTTHESGLFEPYGFREIEKRHYFSADRTKIAALSKDQLTKTAENKTPVHLPKNTNFTIPPYLPNTAVVRRDLWKMYNNLIETDKQIAAVIKQLKNDGLFESTVIVFYSDHGGPLPRQKRAIYDSGIKVPMIIVYPNKRGAGTRDDQLISFVDFAPTTLAMAGGKIPAYMQGQNFLNPNTKRRYIHAAADRFDEHRDSIRAVKDRRFKYIRNYLPAQSYYLPLKYREQIPSMQELLRLRDTGELTQAQAQWFRKTKATEELFDTVNDPHELKNLIHEASLNEIVDELRKELDRWLIEIGDDPNLEEAALIKRIWSGANQQPKTTPPELTIEGNFITGRSKTVGAFMSYQIERDNTRSQWLPLLEKIKVNKGDTVNVIAHRIGFVESDPTAITMQ